jgi:hypothetical protein
VYSPRLSVDISIRAKSPMAGTKSETFATFIVQREVVMQPVISCVAKMATSGAAKFHLHYYAVWPQI